MKRTVLFFAALALVIIFTNTSASVLSKESVGEAPNFKEGDEWSWKRGSSLITIKVIKVENDTVITTSTEQGCNGCKQYRDRHFTKMKTTGQDSTGWKNYDFPLYLGKGWTYRSQSVSPEGGSISYENTCKVVGFREISVLAGKFEGFEIKCDFRSHTGWWGQMVYWYSSKTKSILKVSDLSQNFFLSPEMELISYKLAE